VDIPPSEDFWLRAIGSTVSLDKDSLCLENFTWSNHCLVGSKIVCPTIKGLWCWTCSKNIFEIDNSFHHIGSRFAWTSSKNVNLEIPMSISCRAIGTFRLADTKVARKVWEILVELTCLPLICFFSAMPIFLSYLYKERSHLMMMQ
jgi:hypothetical protein